MRNQRAKVRVAALAQRQFGRVAWWQVIELGVSASTVTRWKEDGYLHHVLPQVYAVGHDAPSVEAALMAALLYAGPGAALSHATGAWWLGLLDERPRLIHVSTPRKCRSMPGIRVYGRRQRTRVLHRGLAVTCLAQTFLDLAATEPLRTLRKALANAEYQKVLDVGAIEEALGRGTRGATKLRAALKRHQPRLAATKSELEVMLIEICEEEHIPLPDVNHRIAGWEPDAYWPQAKLVVELDGHGNHHTPAQRKRDRAKEMALRGVGLLVLRYSEDQLKERRQVADELRKLTAP
jgi:predicted transcriptional regulator of viral defense system